MRFAKGMNAIAPNLTILLGELVGARLISHSGSLMNLAKQPASTIQILGAEKALFRALKTKGNTPKYAPSSPSFTSNCFRTFTVFKLYLYKERESCGDRFKAIGYEPRTWIRHGATVCFKVGRDILDEHRPIKIVDEKRSFSSIPQSFLDIFNAIFKG